MWSDVGGGTCVADNVDSSLLVHSFHKCLSDLSGFPPPEPLLHLEGVIRGACTSALQLVVLRRGSSREKSLHPQSMRGKRLSGKVSLSAARCVCWCGQRESCISPQEIRPGHGIHQNTLISAFDKRRTESLFQSQPPTEKTAGECFTPFSEHSFRSISPHTNMLMCAVIYSLFSIPLFSRSV